MQKEFQDTKITDRVTRTLLKPGSELIRVTRTLLKPGSELSRVTRTLLKPGSELRC